MYTICLNKMNSGIIYIDQLNIVSSIEISIYFKFIL